MSQVNLKPIQLDDDTIIYVQVNDAATAPEIAETIDSSTDDSSYSDDTIRSPELSNDYYNDEEVRGPGRQSKGLKSPHQIHMPDTPSPRQPAPAQRVGNLVKAYTQHLVKDIRTTALTDVEIEKVTLEFGVSLDTELNAYIASSSLECSVKVAIECKLSKP